MIDYEDFNLVTYKPQMNKIIKNFEKKITRVQIIEDKVHYNNLLDALELSDLDDSKLLKLKYYAETSD